MRRSHLVSFALASFALAGCSSAHTGSQEEPTAETQSRIVYGTADSTHTAVVALLGPVSGGYTECSGTIVQVSGGVASVLTAAHCCNQGAPSIVVMSNDYGSSVSFINSSSPPAPAYAVIASSVKYDPGYNGNSATPIDDFCMLQFNAPANTPTIPVATGNDGLALGTTVEYVGFGTTQNNQNNTLREHASAPVDQTVNADYFQYTEGGSSHIGGPCEGDSGGPALLPAGAAQSQQRVVGTTSYGDQNCMQYGVSMRVTSQTGPGGFISTYLGGVVGSSSSSSSSTGSSSSGGGGVPSDCTGADGTIGCCDGNTNYYCSSAGVLTHKACAAGKVCGWSATSGYYACVTPPAGGPDPSGMYPLACGGGSSSSSGSPASSSSSSGGSNCGGIGSSDPTCNTCIDTSCCTEAAACGSDPICPTCLGTSTPPAACNTNAALVNLGNCLSASCNAQCVNSGGSGGGSGVGSTSSGGISTSSSSGAGGAGNGASSSSGTGVGTTGSTGSGLVGSSGGLVGSTGNGNGSTGSGGGSPGADSGCSAAPGGGDPGAPASLAGLLLGAALLVSRRRR